MLASEGGYVDHPKDPGGATNRGITIAVFRVWRGNHRLAPKDLRELGEEETRAIYRDLYWNACHADELPPGVDHSTFDMAVNAGVRRSVVQLQQATGMASRDQDGAVGPRTLAAVFGEHPGIIIDTLERIHEAHYRSLAHFPTFGRGWLARTARRAALARELHNEA